MLHVQSPWTSHNYPGTGENSLTPLPQQFAHGISLVILKTEPEDHFNGWGLLLSVGFPPSSPLLQ